MSSYTALSQIVKLILKLRWSTRTQSRPILDSVIWLFLYGNVKHCRRQAKGINYRR